MVRGMTHILTRRGSLLRNALILDAAVSGANGVTYLAAAGPIGDLLGLPEDLLRGIGAFLVAYAAAVAAVATRPVIPRAGALAVVAGNVVWAGASLTAAATGWHDPEAAGTVWIALQALVVAGFAELQVMGLRSPR
jgi:hypothetical protein